jgi:hypothetical protein
MNGGNRILKAIVFLIMNYTRKCCTTPGTPDVAEWTLQMKNAIRKSTDAIKIAVAYRACECCMVWHHCWDVAINLVMGCVF